MEDAVNKLRENVDDVQRQINNAGAQLRRYSSPLLISGGPYCRICGDMSDLKYGSADNRITRELRVSFHAMSSPANSVRMSLKLQIGFCSSNTSLIFVIVSQDVTTAYSECIQCP